MGSWSISEPEGGGSPVFLGGRRADILPSGRYKFVVQADSAKTVYDNGDEVFTAVLTTRIRGQDKTVVERFREAGAGYYLAFLVSCGKAATSFKVGARFDPEAAMVWARGKTCYADYTPPEVDAQGRKRKGSYPKLSFLDQKTFLAVGGQTEPEGAGAASAGTAQAPASGTDEVRWDDEEPATTTPQTAASNGHAPAAAPPAEPPSSDEGMDEDIPF